MQSGAFAPWMEKKMSFGSFDILTISSAANDDKFAKMITFPCLKVISNGQ